VGAGSDAILLGAETLRGLYPVDTISTVGKICAEVSIFFIFHSFCLYFDLVAIYITEC
jgi:pyruvate kinase